VGFTGARGGMSAYQREQFQSLVTSLGIRTFHHGDCVGADAEAHDIVSSTLPSCPIVVHPPTNGTMRAYKVGKSAGSKSLGPKDYIQRNHDIVDSTSILIATPQGGPGSELEPGAKRSGTWATIRYARSMGRKIYVL
jgi:hypothetical protein